MVPWAVCALPKAPAAVPALRTDHLDQAPSPGWQGVWDLWALQETSINLVLHKMM